MRWTTKWNVITWTQEGIETRPWLIVACKLRMGGEVWEHKGTLSQFLKFSVNLKLFLKNKVY